MSRVGLVFFAAAATLVVCAGAVRAQAPESEEDLSGLEAGDPIPGRYIVVLEEGTEDPASVADDLSGELEAEPTDVYESALEGFAAEVPAGELPELRADPRVEAVVPDRVIEALGQATPTGVRRVQATRSSARAGDGGGRVNADIAVLDSGIYKKHRDLNVAGGVNCVGSERGAWSDGNGHGTHVAGTAAAKDNGFGVVGVAPGARVWGVKVLKDNAEGSISSAICGIEWVTKRAATIEVANMSFGGPGGSDDRRCGRDSRDTLHRAICASVRAGVFYTAAAGNERENFSTWTPAAYDEVLTVTAMVDYNGKPGGGARPTCGGGKDDRVDFTSNYAGTQDAQHTIAAPGRCIRSTWKNGKYATEWGTSMAAPHVAGAAALCIAKGKCEGSPKDVMKKLRKDAGARPLSYGYAGDPKRPLGARYYGHLVYAGGY